MISLVDVTPSYNHKQRFINTLPGEPTGWVSVIPAYQFSSKGCLIDY